MAELKKVGLTLSAEGATDFKATMTEVNAVLSENKSTFKEAMSTWDDSTSASQKLADRNAYLTSQYEACSDKVSVLSLELRELEEDESSSEAAIAKKRAEVKNATASMNYYEQAMEETNAEIQRGTADIEAFGKKMVEVGEATKDVGTTLSKNVTAPLTALGVAGTAMAISFEDSMAKVSTIADESQVPLNELEDAIIELSNETGIAASSIAEDVYNAISAGQETGDAVAFVGEAAKLATAGFTDSAASLDVLTTILNAYGKEADEVTSVSDVLVKTQELGKVTVDELSSSMGKLIPTANASNVSLEQVSAGYATLTSNGIKSAEATTALNALMKELASTGSTSAGVLLEKTGKSFAELMDSGYSLADVLDIVNESAAEQSLKFADMFSSSEAATAGTSILDSGVSEFNDTLYTITNSAGTTEEAFEKMKTTSYDLGIILNTAKNILIDLGSTILEFLLPYIERAVESVRKFSEWFSNLSDTQKKIIVVIGAVVAAIGPLLVIIGTVITKVGALLAAWGPLMTTIGTVGTAIAGAIGTVATFISGTLIPAITTAIAGFVALVGWPVIIATAVIVGLVLMWNKCEWFREGVISAFNAIKEGVLSFCSSVGTFFTDLWTAITTSFTSFVEGIKTAINTAVTIITAVFTSYKNTMTSIFEYIANMVTGVWNNIVSAMNSAFSSISSAVSTIASTVKSVFSSMVSGIGTVFSGLVSIVKTPINAVIGLINSLISACQSGVNGIIRGLNKISFSIPDWVPSIGGNSFGINLSSVSMSKIPYLAKGGTLLSGTALVGECGPELLTQSGNRTTVAPLSRGGGANPVDIIDYDKMAQAMIKAMAYLKIELDDTEVGSFVDERILKVVM